MNGWEEDPTWPACQRNVLHEDDEILLGSRVMWWGHPPHARKENNTQLHFPSGNDGGPCMSLYIQKDKIFSHIFRMVYELIARLMCGTARCSGKISSLFKTLL